MRNQIVRVVLGACLGVASAVAQTPATTTGGSPSGGLFGYTSGSSVAGSSVGSRSLGSAERQEQEPGPYGLTTLFRQHHGEFMDRFERYDPSIEFRGRLMPNAEVNGEPGRFDMTGYDIDAEFPVVITTEAYLLFGVYHYGRYYDSNSLFGTNGNPGINSEANYGDETLTATGLRFGFGWFFTDNLLLEVETSPGAYSDLDGGLHHKDFDYPSSALFTYRTFENFFFKFGARYNQVYRDAPWLPYLGFSWEVSEQLRIDVLAPEYLELSFGVTPATSIAFGTMIQGAQYHVRSAAAVGKQRGDSQVQEVITYLGMTHRFTDNFSVQARGGLVVAGDYKLTTGAGSFNTIDGALGQAFYADVTFGIDW